MKYILKSRIMEFLLISLLVFLSFFLRLRYLSDMEYKGDERGAYELGVEISRGKIYPCTSFISSANIPTPPLYVYLIACFAAIAKSPVGVTAVIAILNASAVIAFFFFLKQKLNAFTVYTSSFLFATATWAVIYSRKIWNPYLLAPFNVLLMISAYKLIAERKPKFWIPLIISLIGLLQLHYSTIFLVISLPVIMLINKFKPAKDGLKYIYISAGLFAVSFIHFTMYFIKNSASIKTNINTNCEFAFINKIFVSIKAVIQTFTGLALRKTLGDDISLFYSYIGTPNTVLLHLLYIITVVFFILGLIHAAKNFKSSFILGYSSIIFLSSVLYILFISSRTGGYYFLPLYPIPFLFIALGINKIKMRILKLFLTSALICFNIYITVALQNFIHFNNGAKGDYGTPYRLQNRTYPITNFRSESLNFEPRQGRRATAYSPKTSMPSEPDADAGQKPDLQPKSSYGIGSK